MLAPTHPTIPASRLHPASGLPIPPDGWPACPLRTGHGWTAIHAHDEGDRQHRGCHLEPTVLSRIVRQLRRG